MTTKRSLVVGLLVALGIVAAPSRASAQFSNTPIVISAQDAGSCATANACATFLMGDANAASFDVDGTFTGLTLNFDWQAFPGGTWRAGLSVTNIASGALVTSTSAVGTFAVANVGIYQVRLRASALASGSASIVQRRGYLLTRLLGLSPSFTSVLLGDGTAGAPSLAFASTPTWGVYKDSTYGIGATVGGTAAVSLGTDGVHMRSAGLVSWSSGAIGAAEDLVVARDAANVLALRNGTNAQAQRWYTTFTDPSNYERGAVNTAAGTVTVAAESAGTGSANIDLALAPKGTGAVKVPAAVLSSHATGGMGYRTGAGGAVTQITSKATGVTLNTVTGQVTMNNAALAAGAKVSFVVTDSAVAATDTIISSVSSGGTANAYRANITAVAAGSFTITVENITAGSLSEAPVVNFAVIKGVAS